MTEALLKLCSAFLVSLILVLFYHRPLPVLTQTALLRSLLESNTSNTTITNNINVNTSSTINNSIATNMTFMSSPVIVSNETAKFSNETAKSNSTARPSLAVLDDFIHTKSNGMIVAELPANLTKSNSSQLPTVAPSIAFVNVLASEISPQKSSSEIPVAVIAPVAADTASSSATSSSTAANSIKLPAAEPILNLSEAKRIAENLLSLIYNRYELSGSIGSQFWHTANNMGSDIWDMIKYKIAKKAADKKQDFLMVFGGSSVTAGHDSYFHQSYPMIVDKRMGPLFRALGINLIVHNIAQGANNCNPYDLCYESMGGHDPDWVGWEQSYNCGHDEAMFELTARWAGWSKNRGVIYYSASGAWAPNACPPSSDPKPYSDEDWSEESVGLKKWIPTLKDVLNERTKLNDYYTAKPSASRFISSWRDAKGYNGIGPHGFNVWESNPKCQTINKEGKSVTGCNGIDATQGCKMKFMTKEAASYGLNGHGAAHHPTRAFHMLRGEAISWLYTMAALDAIYMLENDLKTSSPSVLSARYQAKLAQLQPPMPEPVRCRAYHCEQKPNCYTNYQPHYSPDLRITDLIVGTTNWIPPEDEPPRKEGHLDFKPFYSGKTEKEGEIHLRIKIGSADYMWLFGELKNAELYVDVNGAAKLAANSTYVPASKLKWTNVTPMNKGDALHLSGLPGGDHVLTVVKGTLTHVITWP